jgi:hypothetical protein
MGMEDGRRDRQGARTTAQETCCLSLVLSLDEVEDQTDQRADDRTPYGGHQNRIPIHTFRSCVFSDKVSLPKNLRFRPPLTVFL